MLISGTNKKTTQRGWFGCDLNLRIMDGIREVTYSVVLMPHLWNGLSVSLQVSIERFLMR